MGRAGPGGRALNYVPGVATRRNQGGLGAGLVRGPTETGGQGPPPSSPSVPLFLLVPSVPGQTRRLRGRGRFPNRKGLGQSTGKPFTEVKCERPPGCGPRRLQVSLTSPHSHPDPRLPRGPCPRRVTLVASSHRDSPEDPRPPWRWFPCS